MVSLSLQMFCEDLGRNTSTEFSLAPVTDVVYTHAHTHTHTHTHTHHSHNGESMLIAPEFVCARVCTHTYKEARNEMQSAVNRHLPGVDS